MSGEDPERPASHRASHREPSASARPAGSRPKPLAGLSSSETVEVTCQGVNGTLIISEQRIMCACSSCASMPEADRSMTCTQFEIHAGAATAKKWKMSIKVRPGTEPEVPAQGPAMQIGKWLELRGIDVGKPMFRMSTNVSVPVSKDSQLVFPQERVYASQRLAARQKRRKSDPKGKGGYGDDVYTSDFDEFEDEDEEEDEQVERRVTQVKPSVGRAAVGSRQQDRPQPDRPQQQQQPQPQRHAPPPEVKQKQKHREGNDAAWYAGTGHQQYRSGIAGGGGGSGAWASERAPPAPNAAAGVQAKQPTPWRDASERNFTSINVRWSGERCSVCDADTDYDYDQLVMCDMCGITVHQSCYGVQEVPGVEDMWLCRACELREEGRAAPQCCLCPVAGGALKPTTMQGIWCHAACLQWVPEVTVEDVDLMEPVSGIRSIQRERWELLCSLCKQRMGAKIQCQSCYTAYHPLCGRIAGYYMEISDGPQGPDGPVVCTSFCGKHRPAKPNQSGVRKVEESEAGGDLPDILDTPALFNGQPYALPKPAPLPKCEAGCARAMPLGPDWVRRQHGTGSGATTEAAFWIPEKKQDDVRGGINRESSRALKESDNHTAGPAVEAGDGGGTKQQTAIATGAGEDGDTLPAKEGIQEVEKNAAAVIEVEVEKNKVEVVEAEKSQPAASQQPSASLPEGGAEVRRHSRRKRAREEAPSAAGGAAGTAIGGDAPPGTSPMEIDAVPSRDLRTTTANNKVQPGEVAVKVEEMPEGVPSLGPDAAPTGGGTSAFASAAAIPLNSAPEASERSSPTQAVETVLRPAVKQPSSSSGERPPAKLRKLNSLQAKEKGNGALTLASDLLLPANPHALVAGSAPSDLVGSWCRVWWPEDEEWYEGVIKEYSPSKGQFRVWYVVDNEAEWIDLGRESRNGRLQLLPGQNRAAWPAPPAAAGDAALVGAPEENPLNEEAPKEGAVGEEKEEPGPVLAEEKEGKKSKEKEKEGEKDISASKVESVPALPSDTAEKDTADPSQQQQQQLPSTETENEPEAPTGPAEGTAAVGRKVGVYWEDEAKYYYGTIRSYRTDKGHMVLYDNGTVDWVDVATARIDWSGTKPLGVGGRRGGGGAGGGTENKPSFNRVLPDNVPETIPVVCNGIRGVFNLRRLIITLRQTGVEVSPTEFERRAGRAAAKKWKTSIRLDKGDGVPGMTMESWLVSMGIDEGRPVRASKGTLSTIRRRQATRGGVGGGGGGGGLDGALDGGLGRSGLRGKPGHRTGCMCVICKQARRSGKVWAGMTGKTKEGAGADDGMLSAGGNIGQYASDPTAVRYGKRAYLDALPQVVGAGPKAIHLHEIPPSRCWTSGEWAAHRLRYHIAKDAERTGDAPPPALAQAAPPVLLAGGGTAILEDNLAAAVSLGPGATGGGRTLTLKEKLDLCNATEHERLAFGKSGIHGWGLFAKVPIRQDMMVVEFRGELLRRSAADAREAQYLAQGRDCYIFNLDDDVVLDATRAGTIARFTVRKKGRCFTMMYFSLY